MITLVGGLSEGRTTDGDIPEGKTMTSVADISEGNTMTSING